MRDVQANILEYKQYEFKQMVDFGHAKGWTDQQIQGMLTKHFSEVVEPNVQIVIDNTRANWIQANPESMPSAVPQRYDDIVAAGTYPTPTTGTTVPPGAQPSGIRYVEVHISPSCRQIGTGGKNQPTPSFRHVDRDYYSDRDLMCAAYLMQLMISEANGAYGSVNVISQLAEQLFFGVADLSDPYQVFLSNLGISLWALGQLSRDERSSCRLGSYLVVVCNDVGWGPWSRRGGTTYGNVFLLDDWASVSNATSNTLLMHHEQVHSQQWSKWGIAFGGMYLSETKRTLLFPCQNIYEIAAGLQDGGYCQ